MNFPIPQVQSNPIDYEAQWFAEGQTDARMNRRPQMLNSHYLGGWTSFVRENYRVDDEGYICYNERKPVAAGDFDNQLYPTPF